jgi:DNA-binding NtrC family response regulator
MADYFLSCLNHACGEHKRFDSAALTRIEQYEWPGNIRELRAVTEAAFHTSSTSMIGCTDLPMELWAAQPVVALDEVTSVRGPECWSPVAALTDFWRDLYRPFMHRDLNREQVREVLAFGLAKAAGSYRAFLESVGVGAGDYLRAMDFLRFHDLKPPSFRRARPSDVTDASASCRRPISGARTET